MRAMDPRQNPESLTDDPRRGIASRNLAVCGGTLVFAGTRVDVESLWGYLAGGYDLDTYLDHFPDVSREQAAKAIEVAGELFAKGFPFDEDEGQGSL